ncbi:MAG: SDR family oxidoreductase [Alphaproteobacteria bacterium]|nr:SDR family oxidoreductase [Alphaproteobacteria bacterium]
MQIVSFRLDGKHALVTGASSGIGQASAVALAAYGADVTLMARREDGLNETRKLIEPYKVKCTILPCDISDIGKLKSLIAEQPVFDILLNAAGLGRHKPALDITEQDFDAVFAVNIKAAYFLNQMLAQKLITANKSGSLINISSQMAHVGGLERSVYCASKHAVEGMVKAMAIEWGEHNIRINNIAPTFIRTALTQATFDNPEWMQRITEKIKLGRVGELQDIMGAVIYLASDASALVTGTSLLVDGGWTAE